jgi:hypothetical protein
VLREGWRSNNPQIKFSVPTKQAATIVQLKNFRAGQWQLQPRELRRARVGASPGVRHPNERHRTERDEVFRY